MDQGYSALRLVEIKGGKWGVLTDDNKLVIITYDRRIAKGYMQWLERSSTTGRSSQD